MGLGQCNATPLPAERLHYLDWLRVLAIGGVFLFHAAHVFDLFDFGIKNSEQSMAITVCVVFFFLWGMPFFFLIAGTASSFALQRRSAKEYVRERFCRLFIPFLAGSILFTPVQQYMVWLHQTRVGLIQGSFREFVGSLDWSPSPVIFDEVGSHLWFLGFLFAFSLLTLPLFRWFGGESGRSLVAWLARICDHRGAIVLFILPLALVRLVLQPFSPEEHGWAAFLSYATFFVMGYMLFADERFLRAIRRDWWISLTVGILAMLAAIAMLATAETVNPEVAPQTPESFVLWGLVIVN
ncbi:MAG TPA: acyltransferase family protein, partial [Candidatus Sulfotelmatobacter sp.]|nr:acyltransferase family protein [Candidatus Sulfotelmatobacter sp.]